MLPSLVPVPALAEPSAADRQTARTLLIEGRSKLAAGDAAGALADFKAAHALMRVPTTGLDVARAYEVLGQLVEARAVAHEVGQIPVAHGEPQAFTQARSAAAGLVEQLEGRIPALMLHIEGAPVELVEARVDGEPIPREAFAHPRKLNPGVHEIEVGAAGFHVDRRHVTLKDGELSPVEVRVVLVPLPAANVAAPPAAPSLPKDAPEEPRAPVPLWVWAAGGAGALALAAGVAFAVDHADARADLEQACPGSVCDRSEHDLASMESLRARWNVSLGLSMTFGAVGLAGVAAAVSGFVLRPRVGGERAEVVPVLAPSAQGVAVRGVF